MSKILLQFQTVSLEMFLWFPLYDVGRLENGRRTTVVLRLLKPARETPTMLDDDSAASVNSDVSDTASLSSVSSSSSPLRLSPDSTSLYDVSALSAFKFTITVFSPCP